MKKLAFIFLACMTVAANSATINWGAGSAIYYGTTKVKTAVTGYLLYLGTDNSYGAVDFDALSKDGAAYSMVASSKSSASTTSKVAGSVIGDASGKYGNKGPVVDGSSFFGTVYLYTDATGTYYNLGATHKFDTNDTSYDPTLETFSWQTDVIASNASTSAQGWKAVTPVPEPATGALALAGIALLFKRRKARA